MNTVADFVKQGWDPAQAAILVEVQKGVTVDAYQEAKVDAARLPLLRLVEGYEAKWPGIHYAKGGSRARKAMEIVLNGGLYRVIEADRNGNDLWQVGNHRCSKRGGWCDCKDEQAPVIVGYGKLCQHRLAVALKTNWLGDQHPELLAYLQPIVEKAPGAFVDMLIERDYDWHGEGNRARVAGYWHHGMSQHVRLTPLEIIPVTLPQFQWAMGQLGWALVDLPMKLSGFTDYYYRIAKGDGFPLDESIFWHKGRTWQMSDRERMRRFQLRDIAIHLDAFVKSPLYVELSSYEAGRVMQLHAQIAVNQEQALEVWEALPNTVKQFILENKGVEYAN